MPSATKPTKNQLRRAKKKAEKEKERACIPTSETSVEPETPPVNDGPLPVTKEAEDGIDGMDETNPLFEMYRDIMGRFEQADKEDPSTKEIEKPEVFYDDDDEIPDEDEEQGVPKLSKKKRKEQSKLSIAELKALVQKPEIVDWTDTSASDPRLLVHIKGYRNVVPVPTHWSLKREYLSSKRGVEKATFSLPKFIQETGIAEMRDAVLEKQDQASLKQKQRERVQPKMGKLDIDYQKLYEAFFRFQTKPELTRYGEVYYEGKEYETNLKHLRPGELSEDLKEALNIPPGAPPPWLINQQRFGPPPSYPALKIPGLNAPPPPGGQWGFHPGGYGKPPVDEYNRPLYGGDIFGVLQPQQNAQLGEPVERTLWGELQEPEEESEEEESDEEEEEADNEDVGAGLQTPSGLETPGGMASTIPSEYGGAESVAGEFDLRKSRRGTDTEESTQPRTAYQVVPEQQARVSGFFGGDRTYDLKAAQNNLPVLGQEDQNRKRKKPGDVDVAMDPDALQAKDGMDKEEMKRLYEAQKQQEQGQWGFQEDLSDMIAKAGQTVGMFKQDIKMKNHHARIYHAVNLSAQISSLNPTSIKVPSSWIEEETEDTMMSVLHLTIRTDLQTVHNARLSAPIAIVVTDRLPAALVPLLSMLSIRMLLEHEEFVQEVALHDVVPEVLPQEEDLKEGDTVLDQDLLHLEPFPPGEIATPDPLPELAAIPDLPRPDLVHPHHRRPRSPYRGRPSSPPRERYERRGYSPSRDSASRNPPKDDNYRPAPRERSRSPLRRSANISRAPSPMSSHGSARQIHPDRLPGGSRPRSPVYVESRQVAQEALPTYRDRSPPRRPRSPLPARSPPRDYRQRSPPPPRRRESPPPPRDDFRNGSTPAKWSENPMNAPTGPSYRNGDSRPAPSAPAYQDRYAREAPSPSAPPSAPISMSAHNRPSSAAHHQPPIRPRGGGYGSHPRDGPYGPPRGRGGYYSGPPPTRQSYDSRSPADGPPSGPRGAPPPSSSHGPPPSSSYYDHRSTVEPHRPPFRSNNSSSTTYPRTQRFNHPAAASLPQPIPGGKINSTGIDPAAEKRLLEIEEQKRKLLDAIDEKQAGKRKVLREWERGEAEVKRDGLRSELAERGLESLTGEGGGVGNAF
ncbi:MAG: hypothetical protein Q9204_002643 [Flavoplaca sp. TL-2023a]